MVDKLIISYEIGVKNRAPFSIEANSVQVVEGRLVMKKDNTTMFIAAAQKWDYVHRVGDNAESDKA